MAIAWRPIVAITGTAAPVALFDWQRTIVRAYVSDAIRPVYERLARTPGQ